MYYKSIDQKNVFIKNQLDLGRSVGQTETQLDCNCMRLDVDFVLPMTEPLPQIFYFKYCWLGTLQWHQQSSTIVSTSTCESETRTRFFLFLNQIIHPIFATCLLTLVHTCDFGNKELDHLDTYGLVIPCPSEQHSTAQALCNS